MRWRAQRSAAAWYQTVCKTLSSAQDTSVLRKLHLSLFYAGPQPELENMGGWARHQYDVLKTYVRYITEIASSHAWSHAIYTICLPDLFACLQHESEAERSAGMRLVKRIWQAVLQMEDLLNRADHGLSKAERAALSECMQDLAWRHGQLSREILGACQQAKWDARNAECQLISRLTFGGPANTKFFLEDAFGHLSDCVKRFARHFKMTKPLG